MKPFIRWVGGKRRLLPAIRSLITGDPKFTHYYEPFVGGGAMFWEFGRLALLKQVSDINIHLMDTYAAIQQNPDLVVEIIRSLEKESYSAIKHEYNSKPKVGQCRTAALFLMLNHLCFNGLYRVNKKGEFNVPIGKHGSTAAGTNRPRTMVDFPYESIPLASKALFNTRIKACDFASSMRDAEIDPGKTLVFCDPPYFKEFSNYDKSGFHRSHHVVLAQMACNLRDRGAMVIVCGSDNADSHKIYGSPAKVIELSRTVGAKQRGKAREALYLFS